MENLILENLKHELIENSNFMLSNMTKCKF